MWLKAHGSRSWTTNALRKVADCLVGWLSNLHSQVREPNTTFDPHASGDTPVKPKSRGGGGRLAQRAKAPEVSTPEHAASAVGRRLGVRRRRSPFTVVMALEVAHDDRTVAQSLLERQERKEEAKEEEAKEEAEDLETFQHHSFHNVPLSLHFVGKLKLPRIMVCTDSETVMSVTRPRFPFSTVSS